MGGIQTEYTSFGGSIWKYGSKNPYSSFRFGDHFSLILLFLLPPYCFYLLSSAFREGYEQYCISAVTAGAQCAKYNDILWKGTCHVLSKVKWVCGPLIGAKLKYCPKSAKFSLQRMDAFSFSLIVFFFPKNIMAGLTLSSRRSDTVLCNTVGCTIPDCSELLFIELERFPWTVTSQACHWTLQCISPFPGCLEDIIRKNQKNK